MLTNALDLLATATRVYGEMLLPKSFQLLRAADQVRAGQDPAGVAREIGSTRKRVLQVAAAADPIQAVFKLDLKTAADHDLLRKARRSLGQMLLGTVAERSFEDSYRRIVLRDELRLEDITSGRTDTDYRVFNGMDRPVFRINIKFHGSVFRNSQDLVGLTPNDCFALATYKIHSATKRQREEFIPYLFVVVSVPGLGGDDAGAVVPDDVAHLAALYKESSQPRKRNFEDQVVRYLIAGNQGAELAAAIDDIRNRIDAAPWRVISARRADQLLHELLFERVYAVRVRGFASSYRRAEVDMHFSIENELTALEVMLELLRDHGLQGLTTRIERGEL